MTTAGQIDVKLGLNSDEFIKAFVKADDTLKELEKNLKNSKTDFENVSKAMAGTKNPSKELVNLFEQLKSKLKEDQSALDSFQNKLKGLQGNLLGETNPAVEMLTGSLKKLAGPAAIALVGKKLLDMGKQAVNTAAKFESLAVSFEVLTGGAEAGQKLTNQIIELAAKTPLTTEALTDGARTLLGFGESADEVVNDLKLLGDITGGDAQRMQSLTLAFAQVGSTGRLAGQDLLQMVNAGFNPLAIMSEKTDKSMAQLKKEMSEGKITFNDVKQAMIDATSEGGRFNGMMEKQSQTLEGLKATNQDVWEQVSKAIGDWFLPAAKAVQRAFIGMGEAILSTMSKLKEFAKRLRMETSDSMLQASEGMAKQAQRLYELADKYDKRGNKRLADSYREKANMYDADSKRMLTKYEETLKKEKEISSKHVSGGFSTMSSMGTTATGESETVKKAKKQKDDLLAISKSYAQEMANIENAENAKNELGGFIGSFATGYKERLNLLQWYYSERQKIATTANNNLVAAQQQFNELDQLLALKNAQINKDIWQKRGQELSQIFNNTLNTMLTNYGDFSENMQQLVINLTRYIIKEVFQSMLAQLTTMQGVEGGLSDIFNKLLNSTNKLSQGYVTMGQSAAVATAGSQTMQVAQATLAPISSKVASQMASQATTYMTAANAAEQLAASVAKLAISEAAYSMAKIPFVGGLLAPVAAAATAAAIAAGVAAVSVSSFGGSLLGKASNLVGGSTPKYHSGGVVPGTKEQIAVLKGGERVLNPAETASYNSGQGGESTNGVNNIMMFNIKAWDGKDVINTLKSNSQTINQIVASGIKNNNQGLRTTVQNT